LTTGYEIYVCPTCLNINCFEHCNHCGNDIRWRPPLLDREIKYNGPKPLNTDGSLHRCMQKGTRDGRYYKRPSRKEIFEQGTALQKHDYLQSYYLKHGYPSECLCWKCRQILKEHKMNEE